MSHSQLADIRNYDGAAKYYAETTPMRGSTKEKTGVPISLIRRLGKRRRLMHDPDDSYTLYLDEDRLITWHLNGDVTLHTGSEHESAQGLMSTFTDWMPFIRWITLSATCPSVHWWLALGLWFNGAKSPKVGWRKKVGESYTCKFTTNLGVEVLARTNSTWYWLNDVPVLYVGKGSITFRPTGIERDPHKGTRTLHYDININDVLVQYKELMDKSAGYYARQKFDDLVRYARFFQKMPLGREAVDADQSAYSSDGYKRSEWKGAEHIQAVLAITDHDTPEAAKVWGDLIYSYHQVMWNNKLNYQFDALKKDLYKAVYRNEGLYAREWQPLGLNSTTSKVSNTTYKEHMEDVHSRKEAALEY